MIRKVGSTLEFFLFVLYRSSILPPIQNFFFHFGHLKIIIFFFFLFMTLLPKKNIFTTMGSKTKSCLADPT